MTWHTLLILISTGLASASSFKTTQGTYTVSDTERTGIVMQAHWVWNTPDITPETRRIAGMTLCQNALAEHILVIGNGLGLAKTLLLSDTVQSVTWAHPDPEFIDVYLDQTPQSTQDTDARLLLHKGTVTSLLETHKQTYDIILINVPNPLLAVCRDTLSPAFQSLVRQALTPTGLAAFSMPGSEAEVLPQHLQLLGATQYQQLNKQFLQVLLVPSEPLFFLCAQINYMTTYGPRLEARFSLLDQAETILPRYHLSEIYDSERMTRIKAQFEAVDPNISFSQNLYTLLHLSDTVHLNLLPALKTIQQTGLWCLGIVILCAALTGVLYRTRNRPGSFIKAQTLLTPLGYSLCWIGLSLILMVHVINHANRPRPADSPRMQPVPEWTEGLKATLKELALVDEAPPVPYKEVRSEQGIAGYIFQTRDFTSTIYGYGGPIGLILFVEPDGTLIDFRFTQNYETRRYIRDIKGWLNAIKGSSVFGPAPLQDVYAVSGATLTTRAIMRLMRNSGRQFATQVLAQDSTPTMDDTIASLLQQKGLLFLLIGVALTLIAIRHGKLWSRIGILIYIVGVFGFWLNKQYSTDHIMRLLAWDHVFPGTLEFLSLFIGVPVLCALFGNLYCGYLCPFGALQELVSLLVPKRFRPRLSHTTVQGARFVKYAVLFALVLSVFLFKNKHGFLIDPLTTVFNTQLWPELFLTPLWLFVGVGILFVTRFWCRVLCPTGAFLSLLNRCAWLQRLMPAKKYGRCEFGLTGRDHLDCIYCDRCNIQNAIIPEKKEAITKEKPSLVSRIFLIWLLITASLLILPLLHNNADLSDPNTPIAVEQSTP